MLKAEKERRALNKILDESLETLKPFLKHLHTIDAGISELENSKEVDNKAFRSLYSQHSRSVAQSLEALTHRMLCLTGAAFYQTPRDIHHDN